MRHSKLLLSLAASACIATLASAVPFQPMGSKAASMGGAGIATSPASLMAFNNPALLGTNTRSFDIHVGVGVGVKDTGVFSSLTNLSDKDFSGLSEAADEGNPLQLSQEDINTLIESKDIIVDMDKKGFVLNPAVDLGLNFGSIGTGLFINTQASGVANVDQARTRLIFKDDNSGFYEITNDGNLDTSVTQSDYDNASMEAAINNGDTNVDIVGIAISEIPLAYGHAFSTDFGSISVGGALKYMQGETFYKKVRVDEEDPMENLDNNQARSNAFGVDLGLAFKPDAIKDLTLALVGKNLNSPAFTVNNAVKSELIQNYGISEIKLDPAVRAGAAYTIGNWVEFALDMDLTEDKTLSGYKTQNIGGGVNFDLSILELSVGAMSNLSKNTVDSGVVYTAGIATGPDWLHFELAGQVASKTITVDGDDYPNQFAVNFAISSAW